MHSVDSVKVYDVLLLVLFLIRATSQSCVFRYFVHNGVVSYIIQDV